MLRRAIKRQDVAEHVDSDDTKSTKVTKTSGKALGEVPSKKTHEEVLEKLVLGAADEMLESLEKKSKVKVRTCVHTSRVEENLNTHAQAYTNNQMCKLPRVM